MPTFQQIVKQAGSHLLANDIGKQEHVKNMWRSVEWQPFDKQVLDTEIELSMTKDPLIRLYPSLLADVKAAKAVLREFGLLVLARGGDRAESIWEKKLIAPTKAQVDQFANALKDETTRAKCHTYAELMQTYPEKGHSVDRLVGIHLANALLANNVSFGDSIGVDVYKWGPTAQFANGKKYFSLVPLTSAYCPGEIHRCFGCALAALIMDNLKGVLDLSVADGLRVIIRNVIQRSA
jgi:hypothetical protein